MSAPFTPAHRRGPLDPLRQEVPQQSASLRRVLAQIADVQRWAVRPEEMQLIAGRQQPDQCARCASRELDEPQPRHLPQDTNQQCSCSSPFDAASLMRAIESMRGCDPADIEIIAQRQDAAA